MNYIRSIGAAGEGPQDFTCMGGVDCRNSLLYVMDCTGLKVFTPDGTFVRAAAQNISDIREPYHFCVDETASIYLSRPTDSLPLVKYDKDMNRLFCFGIRRGDADERLSGNVYLLQSFNNYILSIKADEPIITMYDSLGHVLLDKNIDSPIFDSRLSFKKSEQEKNIKNKQKTYRLFKSVSCFDNKVYMLYTYHSGDDLNLPYCNRIAELTFENEDFHLSNIYQLPDEWYDSICRTGERLIAYSSIKQEFQIYEWKE